MPTIEELRAKLRAGEEVFDAPMGAAWKWIHDDAVGIYYFSIPETRHMASFSNEFMKMEDAVAVAKVLEEKLTIIASKVPNPVGTASVRIGGQKRYLSARNTYEAVQNAIFHADDVTDNWDIGDDGGYNVFNVEDNQDVKGEIFHFSREHIRESSGMDFTADLFKKLCPMVQWPREPVEDAWVFVMWCAEIARQIVKFEKWRVDGKKGAETEPPPDEMTRHFYLKNKVGPPEYRWQRAVLWSELKGKDWAEINAWLEGQGL